MKAWRRWTTGFARTSHNWGRWSRPNRRLVSSTSTSRHSRPVVASVFSSVLIFVEAYLKPVTAVFIGVLLLALGVLGYMYYQSTRNDITIRLPAVKIGSL